VSDRFGPGFSIEKNRNRFLGALGIAFGCSVLLAVLALTLRSGMDFLTGVKMVFLMAILFAGAIVFGLVAYVRGLDLSRARMRERSPE